MRSAGALRSRYRAARSRHHQLASTEGGENFPGVGSCRDPGNFDAPTGLGAGSLGEDATCRSAITAAGIGGTRPDGVEIVVIAEPIRRQREISGRERREDGFPVDISANIEALAVDAVADDRKRNEGLWTLYDAVLDLVNSMPDRRVVAESEVCSYLRKAPEAPTALAVFPAEICRDLPSPAIAARTQFWVCKFVNRYAVLDSNGPLYPIWRCTPHTHALHFATCSGPCFEIGPIHFARGDLRTTSVRERQRTTINAAHANTMNAAQSRYSAIGRAPALIAAGPIVDRLGAAFFDGAQQLFKEDERYALDSSIGRTTSKARPVSWRKGPALLHIGNCAVADAQEVGDFFDAAKGTYDITGSGNRVDHAPPLHDAWKKINMICVT